MVFVYAGSILPGHHNGRSLDITSVFEAVGACAAGTITDDELGAIERRACPGEGACAGMFTANTMAAIGEAIGMSLPGSASAPSVDRRRDDDAVAAGEAVVELLRAGQSDELATRATTERMVSAGNVSGELLNWIALLGAIGACRPTLLEPQHGHAYAVWHPE